MTSCLVDEARSDLASSHRETARQAFSDTLSELLEPPEPPSSASSQAHGSERSVPAHGLRARQALNLQAHAIESFWVAVTYFGTYVHFHDVDAGFDQLDLARFAHKHHAPQTVKNGIELGKTSRVENTTRCIAIILRVQEYWKAANFFSQFQAAGIPFPLKPGYTFLEKLAKIAAIPGLLFTRVLAELHPFLAERKATVSRPQACVSLKDLEAYIERKTTPGDPKVLYREPAKASGQKRPRTPSPSPSSIERPRRAPPVLSPGPPGHCGPITPVGDRSLPPSSPVDSLQLSRFDDGIGQTGLPDFDSTDIDGANPDEQLESGARRLSGDSAHPNFHEEFIGLEHNVDNSMAADTDEQSTLRSDDFLDQTFQDHLDRVQRALEAVERARRNQQSALCSLQNLKATIHLDLKLEAALHDLSAKDFKRPIEESKKVALARLDELKGGRSYHTDWVAAMKPLHEKFPVVFQPPGINEQAWAREEEAINQQLRQLKQLEMKLDERSTEVTATTEKLGKADKAAGQARQACQEFQQHISNFNLNYRLESMESTSRRL